MIEIDELLAKINSYEPEIEEIYCTIDYESLKPELNKLEKISLKPDFWEEPEYSQGILKKIHDINDKIQVYDDIYKEYSEIKELLEICQMLEDNQSCLDLKPQIEKFEEDLKLAVSNLLFQGEFDDRNAIITFHAGAGGIEAQDWVEMLYRMYDRWAESKKFKKEVLEYVKADEAGIKTASVLIKGKDAYGFLKSESGVHRLIRISPFDSSGKRHTSFAAIEVMPEIDDDATLIIDENDLRIDKFKSGGAGGQHVNKTESAVRVTHIPTGVVVSSQSQRSQHQNLAVSMKILKSKLAKIKEREHLDRIEDIKGDQKEIGWGSQIRSYVFMPYTLVKDHRTDFETGNISAVMDGDLDDFMHEYLIYLREQKK